MVITHTKQDPDRLVAWLAAHASRGGDGTLKALRTTRLESSAHLAAAAVAGFDTDQEETAARLTAHVFALFHRDQRSLQYGKGSLGHAARRIGTMHGQGEADPGASAAMNRLVSSARGPRARDLRWVVLALSRSHADPPHWGQLVRDVAVWDRDVRARWMNDFI